MDCSFSKDVVSYLQRCTNERYENLFANTIAIMRLNLSKKNNPLLKWALRLLRKTEGSKKKKGLPYLHWRLTGTENHYNISALDPNLEPFVKTKTRFCYI